MTFAVQRSAQALAFQLFEIVRMRGNRVFIFVLFGILCLAPIRTLSQELVDPGELKLHVAKVERTADSIICISTGGDPGVATTEAGGKFVRVVLKGKATQSGLLLLPDAAFYAVFDKAKPGSPDHFEKGVASAAALCLEEGILMLTVPTQFREYLVRQGPISVTLLFAVPQEINRFQVIYPALAGGVAVLETKTAAR